MKSLNHTGFQKSKNFFWRTSQYFCPTPSRHLQYCANLSGRVYNTRLCFFLLSKSLLLVLPAIAVWCCCQWQCRRRRRWWRWQQQLLHRSYKLQDIWVQYVAVVFCFILCEQQMMKAMWWDDGRPGFVGWSSHWSVADDACRMEVTWSCVHSLILCALGGDKRIQALSVIFRFFLGLIFWKSNNNKSYLMLGELRKNTFFSGDRAKILKIGKNSS